jgi:hypothetical protein
MKQSDSAMKRLLMIGFLVAISHTAVFAQSHEVQQLLLNWEKLRQLEENTGQHVQGVQDFG